MIAVILPTRGLTFSEVDMALEEFRRSTKEDVQIFRSSGMKLPAAQNHLVEKALSNKSVTHLLFIEEDTVPPPDGLKMLLNATEDIAFIDYGVNGWSCSAKDEKTGEFLWCGMGCTMIRRHVFDLVGYPWFRSDKQFRLNDKTWIDTDPDRAYGGQDIYFCLKAKESGVSVKRVGGECRHLQLESLGTKEVNNGFHVIKERPKIEKQQIINFNTQEV